MDMTGMMRRIAPVLTLLLLLAFPPGLRAQSDLDLVTASVPPNVMLLFDSSGSMKNALWHDGFDPTVFWDVVPVAGTTVAATCSIGGSSLTVPSVPGSSGTCVGSGKGSDCPDNDQHVSAGSSVSCSSSLLAGGTSFALPDYTAGTGTTRWSLNYLAWIMVQRALLNPVTLPAEDRLTVARRAVRSLINKVNPDSVNPTVRFGLASFNRASSDGGVIRTPIAPYDQAALLSEIDSIIPEGWTPLAETLVDIAEYMTGDSEVASCDVDLTISASSPMDVFCRKNFVVVLTDGEPTRDDFDHGATGLSDFMCEIGNADGDTNESPTPFDGRTDAPPYQSDGTDWLDDVAFHLATTDLRTDLAGMQTITTYTVGFSIDHPLLQDAANNGRGEYFTTTNADRLASDLGVALQNIIESSTSFTTPTVPASRTGFADGFYIAHFRPSNSDGFWEGHYESYRLSSSFEVLGQNDTPVFDPNTGMLRDDRQPFWDVADQLLSPAHPPRSIFTTKAGLRTTFDTASVTPTDLALAIGDLGLYPNDPNDSTNPLPNPADTSILRNWLVDYVYGKDVFDQDRDGDAAELRAAVLGDVFHSNAVIIGPPPFGLSNEDGFMEFLKTFSSRSRRVYFGANDGMLHAIDAGVPIPSDPNVVLGPDDSTYTVGSGKEEFGYVPGFLLDTLKEMPINVPRSYYYVDGNPTATDAWLPGSPTDTPKVEDDWTTVLVTGMRQGGKGYLALDVTDPSDLTAPFGPHGPYPKLLWEFYDPNEPLGESWSDAILTRVKVEGPPGFGDKCGPDDGDGDCREQWVAIFGGGYAKEGDPNLAAYVSDPNSAAWSDESKAVFMVAIDTGQVIARLSYDPNDAQLDEMRYSIPSTPAVLDMDFDGFADLIYVGDLGGQMWKWDVSSVGQDAVASDGIIDSWSAGMFFRSFPELIGGTTLHYRSIFFPPSASLVQSELVLGFGTGERTNMRYMGDAAGDENNRFYVVKDLLPTGPGSIPDPNQAFDESDLTSLAGQAFDPDTSDLGFFVVAEDGEKFTTNSVAFGGFLITTSFLPDSSAASLCEPAGSGFLWVFNLETGGGFFASAAGTDQGRRASVGPGAPSDPAISVSQGADGKLKARLHLQTSEPRLLSIDAPEPSHEAVELIYWRQQF